MSASTQERFASLFTGRADAYGLGHGEVVRREASSALFESHLAGRESGLGRFPMMDGNVCMFAAIDLDEPNFDLARTLQKLIPGRSFVESSRSGNAHVWVFFAEPCPAWAARTVLRGALEAVGRKDVEIFPKQDALREGMVGNYINLPYHGSERPVLDGEGQRVELDEFIEAAEATRQSPDAWERRARKLGGRPPEERESVGEWGESPILHICAQKIIKERETNPILPGARHQVLFHLAVQCLNYRDFDQQEARYWVEEVNRASPRPVADTELDRLFRNAVEGRFRATGCDDPVMQPYIDPKCPIGRGEAGR